MLQRVVLLSGILLAAACAALADAPLAPFVIPGRLPSSTQLRADWLDAPAGKYGPVIVRNGHFYVGEKQIRFLGVNVVYEGCFPDKADAQDVAVKLSRLGVNLVRFHFLDGISPKGLIASDKPTTQDLDPERLARLDYFVAKLKERGVYCDLNLFCGHPFAAGDGVKNADNLPAHGKYVTLFDERLIELQKDFAQKLLTHRNPYTNLTYAKDPAVAMIEITNENSFFYGWSQQRLDALPQPYSDQLDKEFAAYLTDNALQTGKRPKWKENSPITGRFMQFLATMERRYFLDMYNFLKRDIGAISQITGTMAFGPAGAGIMSEMDFVDCHAYWQHPSYSDGSWKGSWTVQNSPMVARPDRNPLINLEAVRVNGKPYTVSEYNHSFPSLWDAEGIPLAAAFAARHDWDALILFSYNSRPEIEHRYIRDFFQLNGHPVKTAQLLAASAMIVRGDVRPKKIAPRQTINMQRSAEAQGDKMWWDIRGMMADIGVSMPSIDDDDPVFRWVGDGRTGLAVVNSAASKSAIGFFGNEPMRIGGLSMNISSDFAAVMVTALDAKPIERSARILITACGRSENTAMKWNEKHDSLVSWGGAPALTETISGVIELPGDLVIFALDSGGTPAKRVISESAGDYTRFEIGPDYSTVWYLAIRR